jgi:hypothetical protein
MQRLLAEWRTVRWAFTAARAARSGLRSGGIDAVVLHSPPPGAVPDGPASAVALRLCRASCLESALVRQAMWGAAGSSRELVIGVTAPSRGFGAHAWLDGDPVGSEFSELTRRPAR